MSGSLQNFAASANNNTAADSTAASTDNLDSAVLVLYVNLFIVAFLSVFILARSFRGLARFHSVSEWSNGIFLRNVYTVNRNVQTVHRNASVTTHASTSKYGYASDDSHSLASPITLRRGGFPATNNYPPHVPSCPRLFRPLFFPLRYRVTDGFALSQLFIQIIWFGILLFAGLYSSPGPFIDSARAGWVGASQLPFLFIFSAKNNIISMLTGFGYEKLNFMHRFLGRVIVLCLNIHALHFFYTWILAGSFTTYFFKASNIWGFIALICVDCLFFFSQSWWRRKAYNLFLFTHIVSYATLLPALWMHKPRLHPWVLACLVIIAFDRALRVLKSRVTVAKLRPMQEMGVTRIECRSINAGWRAGQHVRVRVLSSGMGLFGWLAVHPFSICSTVATSGGEGEGLVLMCKKTKNQSSWTNKLFELAKNGAYGPNYEKGDNEREVHVVIEGPYGGPGLSMFASYSAVVVIAGGSGISYALSILKDLVQKDLLDQSRVKVLELVWVVPDAAALRPFIPVFTSLIRQSSPSRNANSTTSLKISVFYTRAPTGQFPFPEDFFAPYHPKLTLSPGRPKVGKIIDGIMNKVVRLGAALRDEENSGVAVTVCGPTDMADEVNAEISQLDETRRDQVGGVEVLDEVFGF